MYGDGVYFAVDASISAKYASPDISGNRFMFLCSVLTGEYTTGTKGIVAPPVKNIETQEWFDSVCDNVTSPTMFTIFNDVQAYPTHLTIFRQKSCQPWVHLEWWKRKLPPPPPRPPTPPPETPPLSPPRTPPPETPPLSPPCTPPPETRPPETPPQNTSNQQTPSLPRTPSSPQTPSSPRTPSPPPRKPSSPRTHPLTARIENLEKSINPGFSKLISSFTFRSHGNNEVKFNSSACLLKEVICLVIIKTAKEVFKIFNQLLLLSNCTTNTFFYMTCSFF